MNTVLTARQVSLLHVHGLGGHSVSNHLTFPAVAFTRYPSARRASSATAEVWASPIPSGLAETPGRIEFVSYGLVLRLLLLPTPPRGDAVTVNYRPESACLRRTCTSPTMHAHRRTRVGPPAHRARDRHNGVIAN